MKPGSTFGSKTTVGMPCSARRKHHRSRSVAADAKRDVEVMTLQNFSESRRPAGSMRRLCSNLTPPMPFRPAARMVSSGKPGLRH